jgi:predicted nucleic acid-binding protein
MRLVVNTNRIIAALIKDSASRKILLSDKFSFLTVDITKSEINKHKQEILEKANLTENQLNVILLLLFKRIFVVGDIVIENKMSEAKETMDKIDPSDTPFIALALAVENDGIWSDDMHFSQQNKVKVWSTKKLIELDKII